jgi:hypothetical protein
MLFAHNLCINCIHNVFFWGFLFFKKKIYFSKNHSENTVYKLSANNISLFILKKKKKKPSLFSQVYEQRLIKPTTTTNKKTVRRCNERVRSW